MRVLLLFLLLALYANCGHFNNFGQKIKDALSRIKMGLNTTALYKIHKIFKNLEEKLMPKLVLSPKRKARLQSLLKKMVHIKKDHVQIGGDSIMEVNAKTPVEGLLFQGDIVPTLRQAKEIMEDIEGSNRTKRQAFRDHRYPHTIWSTGVNYHFHSSADYRIQRIFEKATKLWEKDTCIDFRWNSTAPNRIHLLRADGCWSYVGKLNIVQPLSLGYGCDTVAIAAHEIGHALGLWHTQSRHDRDKFITFNAHNVKRSWLDQFVKESTETNENYGITYDYGSIMHYGTTSASANGDPTMVPNDPKYAETLGSPFISFYELLMLNTHYDCLDKCNPYMSARCEMGGFPHPRNCSKCVCPSGYGGDLCNEKPAGCGDVLEAKTEYQTLVDQVGDVDAGQIAREDMSICNYWIKAPEGSRIEVKIAYLSQGLAVDGCTYWGVEIKTHADQRLTGYRFCAPEDIGVTLVSSYHIVPVITYNRFYATRVKLDYRIVSSDTSYPQPQPIDCKSDDLCKHLEETMNFCKNPWLSDTYKKELCPKECGFC